MEGLPAMKRLAPSELLQMGALGSEKFSSVYVTKFEKSQFLHAFIQVPAWAGGCFPSFRDVFWRNAYLWAKSVDRAAAISALRQELKAIGVPSNCRLFSEAFEGLERWLPICRLFRANDSSGPTIREVVGPIDEVFVGAVAEFLIKWREFLVGRGVVSESEDVTEAMTVAPVFGVNDGPILERIEPRLIRALEDPDFDASVFPNLLRGLWQCKADGKWDHILQLRLSLLAKIASPSNYANMAALISKDDFGRQFASEVPSAPSHRAMFLVGEQAFHAIRDQAIRLEKEHPMLIHDATRPLD